MTKEDKDLLLKYLCMALPYRVQVLADIDKTFDDGIVGKVTAINLELELVYLEGILTPICSDEIKPYLRPLSSMTNEELFEVQDIIGKGVEIRDIFISIVDSSINSFTYLELQAVFEWLFKNHFDFMGLIPRGLAIEVTEENNPYKE